MKPSDFFLGVVNFLGVLVPGAILLLLRGWTFGIIKDGTVPQWLVFGGVAYVLGQFLLGVTEWLNWIPNHVPLPGTVHKDVVHFRDLAAWQLGLLKDSSLQAQFHVALSYLRINSAEAAAEIDHHMADYKLLRNLVAVLAIDLVARYPQGSTEFVPWEALALLACFIAFLRMFNWAQLLAFQYVCLIKNQPRDTAKQS